MSQDGWLCPRPVPQLPRPSPGPSPPGATSKRPFRIEKKRAPFSWRLLHSTGWLSFWSLPRRYPTPRKGSTSLRTSSGARDPSQPPPRFPRPPFTAQEPGAAHLWDAYPPGHAIGRSDGHTATAQRTLDSTAGHQGPPEAHGLSHNPPTSQVTPREHGSDRVGPPGTATGHANRVFRTPFSSLARDCLRSSPAGTPLSSVPLDRSCHSCASSGPELRASERTRWDSLPSYSLALYMFRLVDPPEGSSFYAGLALICLPSPWTGLSLPEYRHSPQ